MPVPTDIVPLGTASALPSAGRHLSSFALQRAGRVLLFDCGEGTLYRLAEAGLRRSRIEAIFISHFHGDHFFGLPGLVTTMALLGREAPLTVVAPAGLEAFFRAVPGLRPEGLPFELRLVEVPEGFSRERVYEDAACTVETRPLAHRIFAMGFRYAAKPRPGRLDAERARALGAEGPQLGRLQRGEAVTVSAGRTIRPEEVVGPERPGVVFAYCLDTRPCRGAVRLAAGADLLVHEATFGEKHRARAAETGHSTARQAAEVARRAGARRLLLTHFSARYESAAPLVEEARAVFENTEAAEELKRYRLVGP